MTSLRKGRNIFDYHSVHQRGLAVTNFLRPNMFAVALLLLSCAVSPSAQPDETPAHTPTTTSDGAWRSFEYASIRVVATEVDQGLVAGLAAMADNARRQVEAFFGAPFPAPFEVTVHPDRASLEAYWREAWSMPDFSSQCWMVASGTADGLRLLSPRAWASEACEHDADDSDRLQALITHEMTHVYHEQHLPDQRFDGMDDVGWFVEGLATYVSGQLDLGYLAPASEAIAEDKAPDRLSAAWSGQYRYGVCGSIVRFVDLRLGRPGLTAMLSMKTEAELLGAIGLSEEELLQEWQASVN